MNTDAQCKGKTKEGRACQAAATKGGLCFFHANPNKASELGRIGGQKNRHTARDTSDPLIEDVYAGKVHPKTASGLAPLLNLQLRAIESSDLERRLTELEGILADANLDGKLPGNKLDSSDGHSSTTTPEWECEGEDERVDMADKAHGF